MKIGIKATGVALAAAYGGLLLSAQLVLAPPAHAACPGGQWADPITGLCWSQNAPSNSFGGSGNIPCLPGRLGLCLGALQNSPIPGATLLPRGKSWP